jgi:hypothetical protein
MKKLFGFAIVIFCFAIKGYGQLASVVEAPALESMASMENTTLTTMTGSMKAMQKIQKTMEKIMENVKWIRGMQSAKKLIELMSGVACMTNDLDVSMSIYGGFDNCRLSFGFDVNMMKVQSAVDFVNTVIGEGTKMTQGERLENLKNSMDLFVVAMNALHDMKTEVDVAISDREASVRFGQTSADMWSINPRSPKK